MHTLSVFEKSSMLGFCQLHGSLNYLNLFWGQFKGLNSMVSFHASFVIIQVEIQTGMNEETTLE